MYDGFEHRSKKTETEKSAEVVSWWSWDTLVSTSDRSNVLLPTREANEGATCIALTSFDSSRRAKSRWISSIVIVGRRSRFVVEGRVLWICSEMFGCQISMPAGADSSFKFDGKLDSANGPLMGAQ